MQRTLTDTLLHTHTKDDQETKVELVYMHFSISSCAIVCWSACHYTFCVPTGSPAPFGSNPEIIDLISKKIDITT